MYSYLFVTTKYSVSSILHYLCLSSFSSLTISPVTANIHIEHITFVKKNYILISVSKDDMEKLRQALKTLSEAEKQLRVSNDKMTWLTAALLQLAPDKQYILPSSSPSTSLNQGLLTRPEGDIARNSAMDHSEIYAGTHGLPRASDLGNQQYRDVNLVAGSSNNMASNYHAGRRPGEHTPESHVLSTGATRVNGGSRYSKTDSEMIWQAVLDNVQSDSLRKLLAREGRLISVSLGTGQIHSTKYFYNCNISKMSC